MFDITMNQAMLSKLMRLPTTAVSRYVLSHPHIVPLSLQDARTKNYSLESSRLITNDLYASQKRPVQQKVQVFYNFKGGTGKTSLCYQVASHLSLLGFNVLALDLDPQGHLSSVLRIPEDWSGPTIYDVLINELPILESLLEVSLGLHLLPANISMTRIEVPLGLKNKREERLTALIDPLRSIYDFILIDTNPTISTLNMNALVAADRINIVCETQPFSLNGLRVLLNEMKRFFADMNIDRDCCIIPNKYEIKTALSQEVLGSIRSEFCKRVVNAVIRKSEDVNISTKKKMPICAFSKTSSSSFEDILDLVHEIVSENCDASHSEKRSA